MTKIFTRKSTLALVLALGAATLATGAQAKPWKHHHWGWGAGAVAGGLVLGSVLAASSASAAPVYVEDAPPRCFTVERFNAYGDVVGYRRVCRRAY